jgi:hypothetical protein
MKVAGTDRDLFTPEQIAEDLEEELCRLQRGGAPKDKQALNFARRTVNELYQELSDLSEDEQKAFTAVLGIATGQLAFYLKYKVLARKAMRDHEKQEATA